MSTKTIKAKGPEKDYDIVVLSTGEELHVYTPPQALIWSLKPKRQKPVLPMIEIPIAGGGTQKRAVKEKDPEWSEYKEKLDAWEAEKSALEDAALLVLSLRDYQYPTNIRQEMPEHIGTLYNEGYLEWPTDLLLQKAVFLRATSLANPADEREVGYSIYRRTGWDEEVIAQMKDSFRRILSKPVNRPVGETSAQDNSVNPDDAN